MSVKQLDMDTVARDTLATKIRRSKNKMFSLRSPKFRRADGRKTVLELSMGKWTLGQIRTTNQAEAHRISTKCERVDLKVRDQKILAELTY